jgi:hypothetical protein
MGRWVSAKGMAFGVGVPLDDFIAKGRWPKDGIHEKLEVVAGGWITMEVEASGRFEHSPQFHETWGHYREIGEHVGFA